MERLWFHISKNGRGPFVKALQCSIDPMAVLPFINAKTKAMALPSLLIATTSTV